MMPIRKSNIRYVGAAVLLLSTVACTIPCPAIAADPASGDLAGEIREDAGFTGGLIVHLGCDDGRLTAALGAGGDCLVHGLDTDAAIVEALYISMLDGCILCMGDVSE